MLSGSDVEYILIGNYINNSYKKNLYVRENIIKQPKTSNNVMHKIIFCTRKAKRDKQ